MRTRWFAILIAVLLIASSCGSDDSSSNDNSTADDTASAAVTGTEAVTEAEADTEADASDTSGAASEPGDAAVRTGTPSGELDHINWYTFYRPVFGLVAFQFADYPEAMVAANLCESLVRINPDFSLTPGLATWEQVDSTTYRYTIREGASFWDGSPVTADDIVFSLGLHASPDYGSAYFGPHLNVDAIDAVDETTVEVKLLSPDSTWTGSMAGPAGTIYQQAHTEAAGAGWGTPDAGVMCSGPYETGDWIPGESITLNRNDNYWNDDFAQLVGSITFVWPQDPAVIANAMNTGEIDGGWDIPPAALAALKDSDAGTLTIGTADTTFQNFSLIVANVSEGPLADVRLRQALSAALDREAMAEIVYAGSADALYSASPTGLWGYAEDVFATGYQAVSGQTDIAAARALVDEIGAVERPIVMAIPAGDSVGVEMAAAIEQMAIEAGIAFEVLPMPAEQYGGLFVDPATRDGIDLWFTITYTNSQDPLEALDTVMGPTGLFNFSGYSNDTANKLIAQAKAETDPTARAELTVQVQEIFAEELPWIPVLQPRVRVFENNRLTGAPTTFVYVAYPWVADLGAR